MSNREELTRQAEKCLRQGRMDEAITQYQELAELTPVDWGLVKLLADLLERSGQREGAARQFARWADHLFAEGFHSKAAALYKKVLKLETSDEHALWQLGEVSVALKLRADARVAYQRVLELRQRRGDAAGAAVARERLAALDASPPAAGQVPRVYAPPGQSESAMAPAAEPLATIVAVPSATPPPAGAGGAPVALPAAAALEQPPAVVTPHAVTPAVVASPPEAPSARLARLRRDAEDADADHDPGAERKWLAVLEADPADVAVRLRLVQAALDRDDLDAASRLAVSLDASETPSLVVLADLAHRQRRPDVVNGLIADRIHAGAPAPLVLNVVDRLAARDNDLGRAALVAAVDTWVAAGQPGYAVAALQQAAGRRLLTSALYLRWVEICVDAGLPALSLAQEALARAYLADRRLAEARAVAEDVFVREAGAESSRALLLEVLEQQGAADPHQVLRDLLTPPSDSGADESGTDTWSFAALRPESETLLADETQTVPAHPSESPSESLRVEATQSTSLADASAAAVPRAGGPMFDWADLLGRDIAALPGSLALTPPPHLPAAAHQAFVEPTVVEPETVAEASPSDRAGWPAEQTARTDAPLATSFLHQVGEPIAVECETVAPMPAIDESPVPRPGATEPPGAGALDDGLSAAQDDAPAAAAAGTAPEAGGASGGWQHVGAGDSLDAPDDGVGAALAGPEPLGDVVITRASSDVSALLAEHEPGKPDVAVPSVDPPDFAGSAAPSDEGDEPQAPSVVTHGIDERAAAVSPEPEEPQPHQQSPAGNVAPEPAAPRIGDLRGQPFFAEDAPLQPSFSMPTSWLADAPASSPSDEPRRRAPGDDFFFDDDATPPRWAPPSARTEPAGMRRSAEPALVDVEEEVDLTQLLEELKQWDPALPEMTRATPSAQIADVPSSPVESSPRADAFAPSQAGAWPSTEEADLADALPERLPVASHDGRAELDAAFTDLQRHADERTVAEQQLAAGRVFLAAGLASEAARAFERASTEPRARFDASLSLGDLHKSRGQLLEAVGWYEQAAMAPVPDAAVKRAVLYDLAESLEALGETDRALGVLLDLLSQVEDYRDARARLDRLLRVDAGG